MKKRLFSLFTVGIFVASLIIPFINTSPVSASETLTLRPNTDAVIEWDFSEAPNYTEVNEVEADNWTTYTSSRLGSLANYTRDLFGLPDHTTEAGVINSVTVYARLSAWYTGTTGATLIKTNDNEHVGTTESLPEQTTFTTFNTVYALNPESTEAWTWDEIDALQIGYKAVIVGVDSRGYCTQVYVEIDYTLPPVPIVTTGDADDVTATTATLNGNLTSLGGFSPVYVYFQWGLTDAYGTDTAEQSKTEIIAYDQGIIELESGETYHFRAVCRYDTDKYVYGNDNTFEALSAPTVTNGVGASVTGATTARLNGEVTDTGGENPTVHIYWGDDDAVEVALDWDNDENLGAKGVETFYYDASGLNSGTTYFYRCYATNSEGDDWANTTESFITKPAAPTNVAATSGTYTDKVVVTWTKSTGASNYKIYRDTVLIDTVGDVATYDDTGADAPVITPGTSTATDGDFTAKVALSVAGQSIADGTTHTYKLKATNASGDSVDSATDTGYRKKGTISYQWQRSGGDSDASYGNIVGATGTTYDDTDAPDDGLGRYYRCKLTAVDSATVYSASNRGYRGPPSVPTSFDAVTITGTQIDLSWTRGFLSSKTLIVSKIGSYPTDRSDGTSVYFGTEEEFSDYDLDPYTAYYYKAWAYSTGSGGYSAASAEDATVTSSDNPTATTNDATSITRSTAKLNAFLNSDGGAECEAMFEWDIDSGPPYENYTEWISGYTTNQPIFDTIEELEAGTLYYFRVQVRNYAGTVVGLEKSFRAQLYLGNPSDLLAQADSPYTVTLSWVKGEGSTQTIIRYDIGGYPATYAEGNSAYTGAEQSCSIKSLSPGTTYYFRAWAEDGGEYSPSYSYDLVTTPAGVPAIDTATEVETPERWWQATDSTNLVNVPLYGPINNFSAAIGWTNDIGWMIISLLTLSALTFIIFRVGHSAMVTLIAMSAGIILLCIMHILPLFTLAFLIVIAGSIFFIRGRA